MPEPVADPIEVGTILGGTYELTSIVGRGGMGAVWAARHVRLPGLQVAIKVLLRTAEIDQQVYERFHHEAVIVSRIGHPNIVQVIDFNPSGTPYMVMELLKGESLRDRLRRGALPLGTALAITRQVGSALAAAHREHVIHRDLKPENIFLCPVESEGVVHEQAKVLDFGISKIRGSQTVHTATNALMGTPRYMSPEQALGRNDMVDQRTDIFALGAITYEMLTGQHAFNGNTLGGILLSVIHEYPKPLRELAPHVPPDVAAAVECALHKDPDQRFRDAAAFVSALSGGALPPAGVATSTRDTASVSTSDRAPGERQGGGARTKKLSALPRSRPRALAIGSGSLIVAVLLAAVALYSRGRRDGAGGDPPLSRSYNANAVAVMQFENQRADDSKNDWYRKALQTAFNTELSKIPQLSVVAPEIIQRTASEQAVDQMAAAKRLGVSRFVTGSFAVLGTTIRIDAHIVETSKGVQEAAENVEGNQEEFFALQKQLALATLGHLRVQLTEAQEASLKQTTNARPDKYRMLLQAEGVTGAAPSAASNSLDPQAQRPEGPMSSTFSFLCKSAYAQAITDAELAARDLLEQYRRAQEEGNLDLLASLYVSFSDSQRQSVHAYLQNVQSLRVKFADVKIQAREHDVAVSYTRHDDFIDKDTGEPVSLEVRVTKFLVQEGGKWKFATGS